MIRISDIQAALMPLVGWQQDYKPQNAIDDDLLLSESGLLYQQAHPLMTLDNVRAVMPDDFMYQYEQWKDDVTYPADKKVRHKGLVWIATQEVTGIEPADGVEGWVQYSMVSDYLRQQMKAGIAQTVQNFLQGKSLLKESKALLERRMFFDGAGRIINVQPNQGRLVGFEINPVRSMGVTAKIERIGLQMKGATGNVRVYLFHSSQVEPMAFKDLTIQKGNGSFEWFNVKDWYMPYISDGNNAGGTWYLCYNQSDLPEGMEAVNVAKDWSREPCGTCNIGSVEAWRELTKYLLISPFKVKASETFVEYPELWDIEQNIYTNTCNYGMNVEVSVACDLTDFIIRERQVFATVLQRQVAYTLLRTMAMNPEVRVNRNQSNVSQQNILYELDGNTEGRENGLGMQLRKAYEALDIDTRGIDRICMMCRPVGLKYRTV
jgi:hypothetical protein